MDDTPFSPDLYEQIVEGDRLQTLQAVSKVDLERDPLTDEWVLAITPHDKSPQFKPYTRFNVPGYQINNAIREGWAVVARAAQKENEHLLETILSELEPTIPTTLNQEPPLSSWLPTDSSKTWESTERYAIWEIGPTAITQFKRYTYLQKQADGFNLVLPDHRQVSLSKSKPKATEIKPNPAPAVLSPTEALRKEMATDLERVARGEDLQALVDDDEYILFPKTLGLVLGMVIGIGLMVYFFSKDNTDAGASMILICTGIWILKRMIMFFIR